MSYTRRRLLIQASAALAAPYVAQARAAVSEADIGEMLMLGFAGASAEAESAQSLAEHVAKGRVGGVCFLGYNARSKAGVESLTRLFSRAGRAAPPLIAIDQEGGAVQRLGAKLGYDAVPTALSVAAHRSTSEAQSLYAEMAGVLRGAGFNLNLAPVVDLGFEPRNPIVAHYGRAFGKDGASVAAYAGAFVAGHREQRVLTALKHFPGHGSTLTDSHESPVNISATWREDEFTPYRKLAAAGLVDIVMSGHLAHERLTGGLPASLSHEAIDGVLRGQIGFDGVAMTDDLDMAAIRSRYPLMKAIVLAVAAGNDIVLLSNSAEPDPDLPVAAIGAIKEAVASGAIAPARIEQSARRIAALKARV